MAVSSTTANAFRDASVAFKEIADDIFDPSVRRPATYQVFTQEIAADNGNLVIEHDVVEALGLVREWVAEREFADVIFAPVRGVKRTFEKSHRMKRKDAESMAGIRIVQRLTNWLGSREADMDKIVHDFIFASNTGPIGYDGVATFSASHPRGAAGAVQSNTSATAFSAAQHRAVMIAGSSLTDANGEPLGIQYDTLMVGPALADLAREITESTRYAAINAAGAEATASVLAAANVPSKRGITVFEGGPLRVVVNPRFIGGLAQKYLYVDTTKNVTPAVLYMGDSILTERTDPTLENVFRRDEYEWGVLYDLVLMPGVWQTTFFGGA